MDTLIKNMLQWAITGQKQESSPDGMRNDLSAITTFMELGYRCTYASTYDVFFHLCSIIWSSLDSEFWKHDRVLDFCIKEVALIKHERLYGGVILCIHTLLVELSTVN